MLESEGLAVAVRMSEEEYAELMLRRGKPPSVGAGTLPPSQNGKAMEKPKRQKYGNRRVVVDGMKFDSQHEADYYFGQLMPRWMAKELKCVLRQVPFDLPGGIRYIADFVTILPDMTIEAVIDAKSEATRKNRVYLNKKKQVKAIWGIEIQEV